jgi:hypothetical protein
MTRIEKLFLLLTIVGPLHMAEQLMTSIEEFYMLRQQLGSYYAWFGTASTDAATVILITVVWTLCSLLFYAVLIGGTPRLVVLALFGAFGAQEVHHVFESLMKGGYDPGVITCVPYAIAGNLLITAVYQEFRRNSPRWMNRVDEAGHGRPVVAPDLSH